MSRRLEVAGSAWHNITMTIGKMIGGAWFIALGVGLLIVYALLFTTKVPRQVPSTFVCAGSTMIEKVNKAPVIVRGRIDAVLSGQPYADVWVEPIQLYKGTMQKFYRFAAWPRSGPSAGIGDIHFSAGKQEYLFFFRPLASGQLTTSACYGTRALDANGLTAAEQAVLQ